jgi:hypothetical protein
MAARHMVIGDLLPPGDNILRTVTGTSVGKLTRALRRGLAPADEEEAAAYPHTATVVVRAATLAALDTVQAWVASRFLRLVLALEGCVGDATGAALTHADGWAAASRPSGADGGGEWPFGAALVVRSSAPLAGVSEAAVWAPLQRDFWCTAGLGGGEGEAALEVVWGGGR